MECENELFTIDAAGTHDNNVVLLGSWTETSGDSWDASHDSLGHSGYTIYANAATGAEVAITTLDVNVTHS
jgi:hypothetical protein